MLRTRVAYMAHMANFCPLSSTLLIIFLCEDDEIEMKRILANFLALYKTLKFQYLQQESGAR